MKHLFYLFFAVFLVSTSCTGKKSENKIEDEETTVSEIVVTEGLKFNESTLPYDGGVLVANFGGDALNPLNSDGKGYIVYYKNDSIEPFIPADGVLNAPKGMLVKDGYLFVADVNKVVAYNINDKKSTIIQFPENELFVNDLTAEGTTLYASVTNTGNIYTVDISDNTKLGSQKPSLWSNAVGANGLLVENGKMYIASYPADGLTTDKNVVYVVNDLQNPVVEPLITQPGQYDGLALSSDKKTLYVTNWSPIQLAAIDLESKAINPIVMENNFESMADITIENDEIFIPDLVGSKLVIKSLK